MRRRMTIGNNRLWSITASMQNRSRPHRDATIHFDTPRENTHVLQVNRQHYGLQVWVCFWLLSIETAGTECYFPFRICGHQAIALGLWVSSHIASGITNTILFESERSWNPIVSNRVSGAWQNLIGILRLWHLLINSEWSQTHTSTSSLHSPPAHTLDSQACRNQSFRTGISLHREDQKQWVCSRQLNGATGTSQAVWLGETAWLKCIAAIRLKPKASIVLRTQPEYSLHPLELKIT